MPKKTDSTVPEFLPFNWRLKSYHLPKKMTSILRFQMGLTNLFEKRASWVELQSLERPFHLDRHRWNGQTGTVEKNSSTITQLNGLPDQTAKLYWKEMTSCWVLLLLLPARWDCNLFPNGERLQLFGGCHCLAKREERHNLSRFLNLKTEQLVASRYIKGVSGGGDDNRLSFAIGPAENQE